MQSLAMRSHEIHHQFSGVISAVLADKLSREELVMRLLDMEKTVLAWHSSLQQLDEKYQALAHSTQEITETKEWSNSDECLNLDRNLPIDIVAANLRAAMAEAERGEYDDRW